MRLPHHLLRHTSGIYHFRIVVPRDLKEAIGVGIVKRSLHTRDIRAARIAAWGLSAAYAQIFAVLRGSTLTKPPSIADVLAAHARGEINTYVRDAKTGFVQTDGPEDHARLMEYMAAEERLAMANATAAAAREEVRITPLREAAEAQYRQMLRATPPIAEPPASASGFTVRNMISHWETVESPEMHKGTAETRKSIIEDFAEHYGEKRPIGSVRKTDVGSWVAALATRGNSNSTRKTKASHLKMFFECAHRAGHYPHDLQNPAEHVVKQTKANKEARAESHGWEAFSLPQLQTLFAEANLKRTREPHTRRALVLGLYTGARVGEIAQIMVADFEVVEGVKCLRFQGEYKTKVSKRLIPIHPDLLRLGVWEWKEEQQRRGEERLFPTVKLDGKSGKGNAISKGTSNLLEVLKIAPAKEKTTRLGFHSFRDTVIQELQAADPDDLHAERRRAYVGHAPYEKRDTSAHKVHYMRPWKPREIEGMHGGITWGQWLDFINLKILLAKTDSDATLKQKERAAKRKQFSTGGA